MASIQVLEISSTQMEDLFDDITVGIRGGQEGDTPSDALDFLQDFWSNWGGTTEDLYQQTLDWLQTFGADPFNI